MHENNNFSTRRLWRKMYHARGNFRRTIMLVFFVTVGTVCRSAEIAGKNWKKTKVLLQGTRCISKGVRISVVLYYKRPDWKYRAEKKSMYVLLSNSQAGPGRNFSHRCHILFLSSVVCRWEENTAEAKRIIVTWRTRQLSTSPMCMDNPQWMHNAVMVCALSLFSVPAASPLQRNRLFIM